MSYKESDWFKTRNAKIKRANGGHVMGKPIVAAEAFTAVGTWWQQTPWTLKGIHP